MKNIIRILCIITLLSISTISYATTNVWIIAGQSNTMSGSPADVPGWCQIVPSNVEYWVESDYPNFSWISQYTNFASQQNFGPEVLLAYQLATYFPNEQHLIIRFSKGGTNLYTQWCKDCVYYERLLAIVDWLTSGRNPQYKAMIWIQGEGDSVEVNPAITYKTKLTEMVAGIRSHLNASTMPVLILPTDVLEVPYTYIFNVSQGQIDFCREDIRCRIISNSGLVRYTDDVHYTSGSQLTIGARTFWNWFVIE